MRGRSGAVQCVQFLDVFPAYDTCMHAISLSLSLSLSLTHTHTQDLNKCVKAFWVHLSEESSCLKVAAQYQEGKDKCIHVCDTSRFIKAKKGMRI